ncbi:DUF5658 family protein [Pseudomonadota bacterium]
MLDQVYVVPTSSEEERRRGFDRRNHSLKTAWHALHGRRSLGRRQEDNINSYVDRHEPRHLLVFLSIIILCCIDALFTLTLISTGKAYEANPVMLHAIEQGTTYFLVVKLLATVGSLLILLTLKNFYVFSRIKVSYLLYGALVLYAVLIKYEIWLFHI